MSAVNPFKEGESPQLKNPSLQKLESQLQKRGSRTNKTALN